MTVLTAWSDREPRSMAKRHLYDQDKGRLTTASYPKVAWFEVQQEPVGTFGQLVNVLNRIPNFPQACITRGEPLPGTDWKKTKRLLHDSEEKGKATFKEVPRRWLMIDVDDYRFETADPLDYVRAEIVGLKVREILPEPFRDAACHVSLTAGAGLFLLDTNKPKVAKVRLSFLLDRPLGWRQLESLFAGCPVDMSTFRTIQVCYTAAPSFVLRQGEQEGPVGDFLKEQYGLARTAVVEGAPEVTGIKPADLTLVVSNDAPAPRVLTPTKAVVKVPQYIADLPEATRNAPGYKALFNGKAVGAAASEVLPYAVKLLADTPEAGSNPFGGHGRHHALLCGVRFMAKHFVERGLVQPGDVARLFKTQAMAMGLTDIDRQIQSAFRLAGVGMDKIPNLHPIENLETAKVSQEAFEENWREELMRYWDKDDGWVTTDNIHNAILFLRFGENFKGCLAYDELAQTIVAKPPWDDDDVFRKWIDDDDTKLHTWFSKNEEIPINRGDARACVSVAAKYNSFHPVADYLNGLEWDGKPRIDTWLSTYCPPSTAPDGDTAKFVSAGSCCPHPGATASTVLCPL